MKLSDKQNTYQNHNYRVRFFKGVRTKDWKKSICFYSLKQYVNNEDVNYALIYCKEEFLPAYTDDEVKLYCELVNKIPFIKFEYRKLKDTHFFKLYFKDYDTQEKLAATCMIIRYLWENNGHNGNDMYYKVPGYFIKLVEKYPEEDLLYLLLWANFAITDNNGGNFWNSNHSLIDSDFKYPFKYEDLKWHQYSVTHTFCKAISFPYNKSVEEYKQELKDFKIFEYE
jgi:hypothetical protein